MKILTRWNDKVTYYVIIIVILLCFLISLGLWVWGLIEYYAFWDKVTKCVATQDYGCLLSHISDGSALLTSIRERTAFNLSIIGLFLSACAISLYKFRFKG